MAESVEKHLIEIGLQIDAISTEASWEKSVRKGHIPTWGSWVSGRKESGR